MRYTLRIIIIFLATFGFSLDRREIIAFSSYFDSNETEITREIGNLGNKEEERIKKGILYLALAIQEPPVEKASYQATEIFKDFENKNVETILKAYGAMGYSLAARDDKNPLKKMWYVDKSIKTFNRIVSLNKNDWYIRFLRARCFSSFPEMFKVSDITKADFEFLQNLYESEKENISPTIMITVYYYLGEYAKSEKDIDKAINFWKKAIKIADKNRISNESHKKAKAKLNLFEE